MFHEDDLLPISALQHLVFCERQWALIHLEQIWAENRLTVEGKDLHTRVDESETESRKDVRIARAMPLRSLRHGLSGRADVVEFHRATAPAIQPVVSDVTGIQPVALPDVPGLWSVFPVEYKRGKPKSDDCDEVQLCAQALCLEEMLGASIPAGALFYGTPRRRTDVVFDPALRARTAQLAARLHELSSLGRTPAAVYAPRCENCSLINLCMPKVTGGRQSASRYLERSIGAALDSVPDQDTASNHSLQEGE